MTRVPDWPFGSFFPLVSSLCASCVSYSCPRFADNSHVWALIISFCIIFMYVLCRDRGWWEHYHHGGGAVVMFSRHFFLFFHIRCCSYSLDRREIWTWSVVDFSAMASCWWWCFVGRLLYVRQAACDRLVGRGDVLAHHSHSCMDETLGLPHWLLLTRFVSPCSEWYPCLSPVVLVNGKAVTRRSSFV